MIKHIVVYRFSADTLPSNIDVIFNLLEEVSELIPGMVDFSHGTSTGPSPQSRGFTHCFVMDFNDQVALSEYLAHQNHLDVRKKVRELVNSEEDIFEFDYHFSCVEKKRV